MPPLRRLMIGLCWISVVIAFVAAILPAAEAPHLGGSDKMDHMSAFFTICLFARLGYRRVPVGVLFLLAVAFGALIECVQAIPFIHRDAELSDWVADAAASAIGLTGAWPIVAWWDRWETDRDRGLAN